MAIPQLDRRPVARFSAETRTGFLCGLSAYALWGLATGYYNLMPHIPPIEIVSHRAAWSIPLGLLVLYFAGAGRATLTILRNWRLVRMLALTAAIIATNWCLFIWAVSTHRMLEASLAYYINPLMSVAIGFVLLGERLNRAQSIAIAIATIAVLYQTVAEGIFPWLALTIASTFAVYGYLRKTMPVGAVEGFMVETLLMCPVAIAAILWFEIGGTGHLFAGALDALYLVFCAVMTGVPLILFTVAARRLRLSTVGLMQFLGPSIGFMIAIFGFHEPLSSVRLITFLMIWTALAIFSWSALRRERPPVAAAPV